MLDELNMHCYPRFSFNYWRNVPKMSPTFSNSTTQILVTVEVSKCFSIPIYVHIYYLTYRVPILISCLILTSLWICQFLKKLHSTHVIWLSSWSYILWLCKSTSALISFPLPCKLSRLFHSAIPMCHHGLRSIL